MDRNLPATTDVSLAETDAAPLPPHQRISVAFMPLALVTFIILAFAIAAWTFLSAGG
jgi:hypothetical protein